MGRPTNTSAIATATGRPWAERWAQSTAVAFERYAGLRVPGQTRDGDFQLATTRTIPGDKDEALRAWLELVGSRAEFGGVPIAGTPSASRTERWRYWRVPLADGSRVAVNICDKPGGKASIGLVHSRLDSVEAIEYWRPIWKGAAVQAVTERAARRLGPTPGRRRWRRGRACRGGRGRRPTW